MNQLEIHIRLYYLYNSILSFFRWPTQTSPPTSTTEGSIFLTRRPRDQRPLQKSSNKSEKEVDSRSQELKLGGLGILPSRNNGGVAFNRSPEVAVSLLFLLRRIC